MRYKVELAILTKKGTLDPQGKTVGDALNDIGYPNIETRIGKYISYETDKPNEEQVRAEIPNIQKAFVSRGIVEFNTQECRIYSITLLDNLV